VCLSFVGISVVFILRLRVAHGEALERSVWTLHLLSRHESERFDRGILSRLMTNETSLRPFQGGDASTKRR
jgi:hypothetical protein